MLLQASALQMPVRSLISPCSHDWSPILGPLCLVSSVAEGISDSTVCPGDVTFIKHYSKEKSLFCKNPT